jgi:hypothetical protein
MAQFTRRKLLHLSASAVAWPMLATFHSLAAPWRRKVKITDIKVMALQGGRTYNLVKSKPMLASMELAKRMAAPVSE